MNRWVHYVWKGSYTIKERASAVGYKGYLFKCWTASGAVSITGSTTSITSTMDVDGMGIRRRNTTGLIADMCVLTTIGRRI